MTKFGWSALASAALTTAALTVGGPAKAADNVMQQCGAKYQAAKKDHSLPAGQTWAQFLAQCRTGAKATKPVAATVNVKTATTTKAKAPAGQPSAAQLAMRARMKQCSAQWQAEKAAKKLPAGATWPKYWSQCSAKLKG